MDDAVLQHAVHLAQLRSALAGYLAFVGAGLGCEGDIVRAALDGGTLDLEVERDGVTVFAEGGV